MSRTTLTLTAALATLCLGLPLGVLAQERSTDAPVSTPEAEPLIPGFNAPMNAPSLAPTAANNKLSPPDELESLAREVLMHATDLIGRPYRYGGNGMDADGFDCSGLVRFVYKRAVALPLPRSAAEQSQHGQAVEVALGEALQLGDLVFFNTLRRPFSHVGIYLGDGRFIHSPSRGKRVEIVSMEQDYWKKRFDGARRLLVPGALPAGTLQAAKGWAGNTSSAVSNADGLTTPETADQRAARLLP